MLQWVPSQNDLAQKMKGALVMMHWHLLTLQWDLSQTDLVRTMKGAPAMMYYH